MRRTEMLQGCERCDLKRYMGVGNGSGGVGGGRRLLDIGNK